MMSANFVLPIIDSLWSRVVKNKGETEICGIKVFKRGDAFLAGKCSDAFSYAAVESNDRRQYRKLCETFAFLSKCDVKTWGIFYFLRGIDRLQKAGVSGMIISREMEKNLRSRLDWRSFATENGLHIGYPSNYLGCAFGIAQYRERLGWDKDNTSNKFLDKIIEHCEKYSGKEYMFCDESDGDGRFDRYSFLLPAELATRLWEMGSPVPERLIAMVRKSCDAVLMLANGEGCGFSYGRSLGAYGDTAVLEILAIAHKLRILTPDEEALAYTYSKQIIKRFQEFWYRKDWRMFDLWEQGRRGDFYLSKDRILGDNLSISMHLLRTSSMWKDYSFEGQDVYQLMKQLPSCKLITFRKTDNEHLCAAFIRMNGQCFTVPFVNSGVSLAGTAPYQPIPQQMPLLCFPTGINLPVLNALFITYKGYRLISTAFFTEVKVKQESDTVVVQYYLDRFYNMVLRCRESNLKCQGEYRFSSHKIEKTESYVSNGKTVLSGVYMEFPSKYIPKKVDRNTVYFDGEINSFSVEGLDLIKIDDVSKITAYNTPVGSLKTRMLYGKENVTLSDKPLQIKWTLFYGGNSNEKT